MSFLVSFRAKSPLLSLVLLFALAPFAQAADETTSLFKSLQKVSKGAFGLNVLQGTLSRRPVLQGSPSGKLQFQAAYRNDIARKLAERDFYVGNLFTTNYYELMGEYVYGNALSSHELDHDKLREAGASALSKTSSMVRHWVLEQQYVKLFPASTLARGFRTRGISGSEFEQEYANYFFDFYLSVLQDESQILPALLLGRGSPIAESGALDRARQMILEIYDSARAYYGEADPRARRLYQLRNLIHNQLSQSVVGQIDSFLRDYPGVEQEALRETKRLIVAYYAVTAKSIAVASKKADLPGLEKFATELAAKKPTVAQLFELSTYGAVLRRALLDNGAILSARKAQTLVVLISISQYLSKELNGLRDLQSPQVSLALLNLIYMDGFLITDNWLYFTGQIEKSPDTRSAGAHLTDAISIANDTLIQAFEPSLPAWTAIDSKMQNFIDNTAKSSSLNTAAMIAEKVTKE